MEHTYTQEELFRIKEVVMESVGSGRQELIQIEGWIDECLDKYLSGYTNESITSADTFVSYHTESLKISVSYLCRRIYRVMFDRCGKKLMAEAGLSQEWMEQTYFSHYAGDSLVVGELEHFMVEIDRMDMEIETARQNDSLRKASRGRVIGGGFGIQGAVRGMLMAGVTNALIGAGYSAVNTLADTGRRLRMDDRVMKMVLDRKVRDHMYACLNDDLSCMMELKAEAERMVLQAAGDIFKYYNVSL